MIQSLLLCALLTLLVTLPHLPARAAEQAGVSAAVHGDVALTRAQAGPGRPVQGGESILLQDAIRSGSRSGMQILLLDQTVFTIGPDSEMVVDEFVYDPRTSAGKVTANITQGVFRFVSGRVAAENPANMNVKLPSGTLGIRGTMVAGQVDAATGRSLVVLLGEGQENDTGSPSGAIQVCNVGRCVDVRRPGYGTRIDGHDEPPTDAFPVPAGQLTALTQLVSDPEGVLDGKGDKAEAMPAVSAAGDGGDTRSPSDVSGIDDGASLAASGVSLEEVGAIDGLGSATDLAAQDARKAIVTPGGVVLGEGSFVLPEAGSLTTYGQLSSGSIGGQMAEFTRSGVRLSDGGSYDFSLGLDLGSRVLSLDVTNVNSPSLGISGQSIRSGATPFGPSGDFVRFDVPGQLAGNAPGCSPSCDGFAFGWVVNGADRVADKGVQALRIEPNAVGTAEPGAPVATVPQDSKIVRTGP